MEAWSIQLTSSFLTQPLIPLTADASQPVIAMAKGLKFHLSQNGLS